MASTGFSREADQAGTNPENSPMMAETITPNRMLPNVKVRLKLKVLETNKVSRYTMSSPTIPPISDKNTDSNKN